jgi:hypothetical protein
VPGTGTSTQQVHDFNGAILASGLIWTVPAEERNFWMSRDGRRAYDALDTLAHDGALGSRDAADLAVGI